jgi:glycosyltransferase involved in cell wall biosynthesis
LVAQGVSENLITVIRNIRDWHRFNPELYGEGARPEWGLLPGQPAIGMVGLLIPWKGQKVFIEAAARVLAVYPEARFFVIGGGVDAFPGYPSELHEAVRQVGGEGRIMFLGQRKDVPHVIAGLDVLVHASVEPEPAGAVIVEGMVMGKPVVATNIGGPPEVIEDGQTGFLVPPGSPEALTEKILLLIRNPELRLRVGQSALEFVKANFSLERDSRRLEAVYEEVLGQKSGRPVAVKADTPGARVS